MQIYTAQALINLLLSRRAHKHTHAHKESDQMVFNWTSSPEDSRAEDQGLSGTFPPRVVFKVTRSVEEEEEEEEKEENDGQDDHQGHDDEQERSKTRSTVLSQTSQMYLSGHNNDDDRSTLSFLCAPCVARPLPPPRRAAQRIGGWGA